jgi:PAS domain S-box-containing protein
VPPLSRALKRRPLEHIGAPVAGLLHTSPGTSQAVSADQCESATRGVSTRENDSHLTVVAEERESLLAYIIESSADAIISKTPGGVITSWNKAAERIFGYTAIEAVNRDISIIEVPNHQDETDDELEQIRKGEPIDHFRTIRRRKDGNRIDICLTVCTNAWHAWTLSSKGPT